MGVQAWPLLTSLGSQTDFFSCDFFLDTVDMSSQTEVSFVTRVHDQVQIYPLDKVSAGSQTFFSQIHSSTQYCPSACFVDKATQSAPSTVSAESQATHHVHSKSIQVNRPNLCLDTTTCQPSDPFEDALLYLAVMTATSSRGHRPHPRGPFEWALIIMFLLLCALGQGHGMEQHLALEREKTYRDFPTGDSFSDDYKAIAFSSYTY